VTEIASGAHERPTACSFLLERKTSGRWVNQDTPHRITRSAPLDAADMGRRGRPPSRDSSPKQAADRDRLRTFDYAGPLLPAETLWQSDARLLGSRLRPIASGAPRVIAFELPPACVAPSRWPTLGASRLRVTPGRSVRANRTLTQCYRSETRRRQGPRRSWM
jgi:hypothetical protein